MRAFTHFLVEAERIERDPLARFKVRSKGDKPKSSFTRRALTVEEINALITAAESSSKVARRLPGVDRAWLYRLAVSVGFRAHELSSLSPLSFNLDEGCVLLERGVSKRRKYDRAELHPSLLAGLRLWLANKPNDQPLWPGSWWCDAAKILRRDLRVARIPSTNDAGRVDFHSLRTTFITNLVGTSAPTALVQRIARLSTPNLLVRYYKPHDKARMEAVAAMPALA
jgi:integrase